MGKVKVVQECLDQMVAQLKLLRLPALGPEFSDLGPAELRDALVVHRATKKYQVRSNSEVNERKLRTIARVLEMDSHGLDEFDYRKLTPTARKDFLNAQTWLRELFGGFQHTYALRFPSGEGFVSARGLTDLIQKLNDDNQWLVSPDLVNYSVNIIIRHRALANVVRRRFRHLYGDMGVRKLRTVMSAYRETGGRNYKYVAFKFMFRACTKLHRTARLTTVPKDNEWDRAINCEALWNMICQLSYSTSLRSHILCKLGIDLDTLQGVHRALVRCAEKATIDLKSASDSNFMCVLRSLWPKSQVGWLERMRTGIFELADGTMVPMRMFAPMGCGCTFEVMTLTLLAHCRVLDKGATVFGDDIIIAGDVAERLRHNLEEMGWKINVSKTFLEGNFRESCGAFACLITNELLVSYDIERPETWSEVYTVAHKLLVTAKSLYAKSPVRRILLSTYGAISHLVARDSWASWEGRGVLAHGCELTEYEFFVPPELAVHATGQRSTTTKWTPEGEHKASVVNIIATAWQTPVRLQNRIIDRAIREKPPKVVDAVHYAAYMRRGVYRPQTGSKSVSEKWICGARCNATSVELVNIVT